MAQKLMSGVQELSYISYFAVSHLSGQVYFSSSHGSHIFKFLRFNYLTYHRIHCVLLAETEQGVAQAIIRAVPDFKREPWPKVSDKAKELVKRMLDPDPKKRLSAQEVLGKCNYYKLVLFILIC